MAKRPKRRQNVGKEAVQYEFNNGYYDELLSKLNQTGSLLNHLLSKSEKELEVNKNLFQQYHPDLSLAVAAAPHLPHTTQIDPAVLSTLHMSFDHTHEGKLYSASDYTISNSYVNPDPAQQSFEPTSSEQDVSEAIPSPATPKREHKSAPLQASPPFMERLGDADTRSKAQHVTQYDPRESKRRSGPLSPFKEWQSLKRGVHGLASRALQPVALSNPWEETKTVSSIPLVELDQPVADEIEDASKKSVVQANVDTMDTEKEQESIVESDSKFQNSDTVVNLQNTEYNEPEPSEVVAMDFGGSMESRWDAYTSDVFSQLASRMSIAPQFLKNK